MKFVTQTISTRSLHSETRAHEKHVEDGFGRYPAALFPGASTLVSEIKMCQLFFGAGCRSDMPTDCAQLRLFPHTYGEGTTLSARNGTGHRGQFFFFFFFCMWATLIYCMCVIIILFFLWVLMCDIRGYVRLWSVSSQRSILRVADISVNCVRSAEELLKKKIKK